MVGLLGALGSFTVGVPFSFLVDPRGLPLPRYMHNTQILTTFINTLIPVCRTGTFTALTLFCPFSTINLMLF